MGAGDYSSAAGRWQGIGPYYAMFPTQFADEVVERHTDPGDKVLDPFAGRGTAIFSAAHQGRRSVGVEVNPVGWVYAKAKLQPAAKDAVMSRIAEIDEGSYEYGEQAESLPDFFDHCFSSRVCKFLVAARDQLDWQGDNVDLTVAAFLMVYLHGKLGAALSNQMRQTKSMSPDYAVRWWKARELTPPVFDPVPFLTKRIDWRYAKGVANVAESEVYLGNSEDALNSLQAQGLPANGGIRLLFTSPPYFSVTNYHYDQWLRLWLLGGPPSANRLPGSREIRGKFESEARYRTLLKNVFSASAKLMAPDSTVYVRTGLGCVTLEATLDALREAFPNYEVHQRPQPYSQPTQTSLFGDFGEKDGEVDIIMASSTRPAM
ncbi:MAG: DNA methyltransferase [Ktedonobacteraceae bacterium]